MNNRIALFCPLFATFMRTVIRFRSFSQLPGVSGRRGLQKLLIPLEKSVKSVFKNPFSAVILFLTI